MIHSERLSAFLAFGELLNFTRASERMHLSQPSLHAQVKKLEGELDVALYERIGRQLRLTGAGERLLAHAREVQRRDEGFLAELSGRRSHSPLVLAAGEGALLYLLGDALKALGKTHGQRLRVLTRNSAETIKAVLQGEATVGVTVTSEEQEGLSSTRIKVVGMMAVMAKNHPLAKKRTLTVPQLAGISLIAAPSGFPHRASLEQQFATQDVAPQVAVEANGWESMMHLASLGLGVALVNDFCRVPKGCVSRAIRGTPRLEYRLLRRSGQPTVEERVMCEAITAKR